MRDICKELSIAQHGVDLATHDTPIARHLRAVRREQRQQRIVQRWYNRRMRFAAIFIDSNTRDALELWRKFHAWPR